MKIHVITPMAMDGNIFLIEDEGFILIDSGTGAHTIRQVEQIRNIMGDSGRPENEQNISALILTHLHFDHSGGARQFKETFDCEVFIHEKELQALREGDSVATGATMFFASQPSVNAQPLDLSVTLVTGKASFQILETPGHSPGSISLYEEEAKTLISGDTVFPAGGIGRWDLAGGNYQELMKSIKRLSQLDVSDIYAGHGPVVRGGGNRNIRACLMNIGFF